MLRCSLLTKQWGTHRVPRNTDRDDINQMNVRRQSVSNHCVVRGQCVAAGKHVGSRDYVNWRSGHAMWSCMGNVCRVRLGQRLNDVVSGGVFACVMTCCGIVCLCHVVLLLVLKLIARQTCHIFRGVHVAMHHHSNHRL